MKKICLSICALMYYACIQASQPSHQLVQEQLTQYLQADIDAQQRLKDLRIQVLVTAANKLHKGISRVELKEVRMNLSRALLQTPENEAIIANMADITRCHKRTFPCCCKPWVWQTTIDRQAQGLRTTIDRALKQEHGQLFSSLKPYGNVLSVQEPVVTAYPVVISPSAPQLEERLLDQHGQHVK